MAAAIRLRPLRVDDEGPGRLAHEELSRGGYSFFLGYGLDEPWADFVERTERHRRGIDIPPQLVRAAFLVAWVGDEIVGRASIRFELNEYLALAGGHIGYAVLPAHRRRGCATKILQQSLVVARAEGVDDVLVTCDIDNVGSRAVIERNGGEFESTVYDTKESVLKRRYWLR